ncbi:MAG: helix-turn-helix transcriptional regulator [Spirochaetaceae bacterium]|nr:helix-turn-helix transcriptional regulator [Spirochaetaceae bacterium]
MMANVKQILAANILLHRVRRNLSRERLAELSGLSAASIKAIENGKRFPSSEKFQSLADALECKPCELLYEGDEWESRDTIDNLAGLNIELREKINDLLEEVFRRRLGL